MNYTYTYSEAQVRRFPEQQDAMLIVDDFITKLDVWTCKKLHELDRSEKE